MTGDVCHRLAVSRIAFSQVAIYLVQFLGIAIVVYERTIELVFRYLVFCHDSVDIFLCFLFLLGCGKTLYEAKGEVVVVEYFFHLVLGEHTLWAFVTRGEHLQEEQENDDWGKYFHTLMVRREM